jgi:hypothetical protein
MSTTTRSRRPRRISRRRALPNPVLGDGRNSSVSHTPMKGAGFFSSSWRRIPGERSEKKLRTRPSYGFAREPGDFFEEGPQRRLATSGGRRDCGLELTHRGARNNIRSGTPSQPAPGQQGDHRDHGHHHEYHQGREQGERHSAYSPLSVYARRQRSRRSRYPLPTR